MNLERLFISIKFFSFFLLCSKICITENVHLLTGDKSEVLSESLDNKIVFLASFSTCLLMVYRNVINFSTLVLYPAPLMRVFISSKIFFFLSWSYNLLFTGSHWPLLGIISHLPFLYLCILFSFCFLSQTSYSTQELRKWSDLSHFWFYYKSFGLLVCSHYCSKVWSFYSLFSLHWVYF